MNVKKTKSSKKIVLKITMSMTTCDDKNVIYEGTSHGKACQGHSTHDAPSELKTRKSS